MFWNLLSKLKKEKIYIIRFFEKKSKATCLKIKDKQKREKYSKQKSANSNDIQLI